MQKTILSIILVSLLIFSVISNIVQRNGNIIISKAEAFMNNNTQTIDRKPSDEKLVMKVQGKEYIVRMYDNPTAKDFKTLLPITLKFNDYGGFEKYTVSPRKLSMKNAPKGADPILMEFGYYEPTDWICVYYGQVGWWDGKVQMGMVDAAPDDFRNIPNGTPITIDVAK